MDNMSNSFDLHIYFVFLCNIQFMNKSAEEYYSRWKPEYQKRMQRLSDKLGHCAVALLGDLEAAFCTYDNVDMDIKKACSNINDTWRKITKEQFDIDEEGQ
jgi:hypothetical protein